MISSNRGRYPAPVAATAGLAPHAAHATGAPPPALAAAPAGFTVADLTAKAGAMTGQQDYTAARRGPDGVVPGDEPGPPGDGLHAATAIVPAVSTAVIVARLCL